MIEPVKGALVAASLAALLLSACGSDPADSSADPKPAASSGANGGQAATAEPAPAAPAAAPAQAPLTTLSTLTLGGYGGLTIGKPVPAGSDWAARGAQASDACLTLSSPEWPGAYAIVEEGVVRRITVSNKSDAKLIEGIGPGSTEAQVLATFPSFRASPHKYVDAPAKYLTQPGNDPRLHFEIDDKGKVSLVHVGVLPTLEYVEGCS